MARWYPTIKTVAVSLRNVDKSIMYHWRRKYLRLDRLIRLTMPLLNKLYRKIGREVLTPEEGTRTSM
jgi:hypothetical protein